MIDPDKITNYNRTEEELQCFILFAIMVAGKKAKMMAPKLDHFLFVNDKLTPFEFIRMLIDNGVLYGALLHSKIGKYKLLLQSLPQLVNSGLDLHTCTIEDLEKIKGIGPKSSRFFILHSRPNQRIACLDVWILKYLKSLGYKVPKQTPSGKKYLEIEKIYLKICDDNGYDPAEFDLFLWKNFKEEGFDVLSFKGKANDNSDLR